MIIFCLRYLYDERLNNYSQKEIKALKKFITVICLVLSACFIFSSCSGCKSKKEKNWKVEYVGGEVSSNGGFAVQVGDYLYYINGIEESTADNTFGDVVKGSLVRTKISDLANPAEAKTEVVVPKIFASTYYNTGLCIFGDYVYYGTPNDTKDKTGKPQNTYINFQRTKLDGTSTSDPIVKIENMAVEYKFVKSGDSVYLMTVEESDSVYTLTVYNQKGDKVFTREKIDSYVIPDEYETDYVYFTDLDVDKDENDEAYGILFSYKFGEKEAKNVIVAKEGLSVSGSDFGMSGWTFKLTKHVNGTLYFTITDVESSGNRVCYVKTSELVAFADDDDTNNLANVAKIKVVGGDSVSSILGADSIYVNENKIIYYNSDNGLFEFDPERYVNEPDYKIGTVIASDTELKGSEITILTYDSVGQYVYYTDSNSYLYRISVKADGNVKEGEQITSVAIDTDWYVPEIFGDYVLVVLDSDPFTYYAYALEVDVRAKVASDNADVLEGINEGTTEYEEKLDELVEEYFKGFTDKEEESFKALRDKLFGKVTKKDKKTYESYMSSNYDSDSSSSSSN